MNDNNRQQLRRSRYRRGIYLLPNLFTTGALLGGFYGVIAAIGHRFTIAAIAVFVAMILDGLDGRVARLTNTQSPFGAEYDSLSDMISFGLAPALIVYQSCLVHLRMYGWFGNKVSWIAAFIYVAATALRLARFNIQVGVADKRFFQGLPSPSAAAMMVGFVWTAQQLHFHGSALAFPALVLSLLTGGLMVSNVSYYSFKDVDFHRRLPFIAVIGILGLFVLVALWPAIVLFSIFALYGISGMSVSIWRRFRRFRRRKLL